MKKLPKRKKKWMRLEAEIQAARTGYQTGEYLTLEEYITHQSKAGSLQGDYSQTSTEATG